MYKKIYFFIGLILLTLSTIAQNEPQHESRFSKVVLTKPGQLDEPMEITFLPDKRVLFVERKGNLKAFNPTTKEVTTIATIPVNTKYTNRDGVVREAEEGLMGLIADPNFAKNHWIYMYYADPAASQHLLTRWELKGDVLVEGSKKVLLEVPTQRRECCHTGGGMVFDKKGNLFLTTGNNTSNSNSDGYAPLDERPGQADWDDQRGASNTNDLRGKILRIHPEANGTYTIPEGNLFSPTPNPSPVGRGATRPEIYTMGHRNPWRPTLDSKTGFLYWGEVGPDASEDGEKGPRGYDEFNQAKGPGYFGWPYFIGDNKGYPMYDFATKQVHPAQDPAKPINESPNNTGLRELPAAQKAMIWYPYGNSPEFPLLGSSGRSATGGPVFRQADFKNAKRPFPAYYEGKWLTVEFMRGWILSVTMDEKGDMTSMEKFLPNENFSSAIDMDFGPEGDLYVLEYGSAWFRGNENARLVKIEYNGGNRKPVVKATASKTGGAVPFKVTFSADGTKDADNDALKYQWSVSVKGSPARLFNEANPTVDFVKSGLYQAVLTVTDAKGGKSSKSFEIKAGNEPPTVVVNITKGNKTFYFENQPLEYQVKVSDKEDGSVDDGKIDPKQVAMSIDYMADGFDPIEVAQSHRAADAYARFTTGQRLMNMSDCKSCHLMDKKSVGPSYLDVAKKYKGDATASERLSKKIIAGGGGVWGDHAMSAHPQISASDAATMTKYILSLEEKQATATPLPLKGSYTAKIPASENKGSFVIRAAYSDRGTKTLKSIESEQMLVLRNPELMPEKAEFQKNTQFLITPGKSFSLLGNDSHIGYQDIDLNEIKQVELSVQATQRAGAIGGFVELRLDSPTGQLLGKTAVVEVSNPTFGPPPTNNNTAAGQPRPANATPPPPRRPSFQALSLDIPANLGKHDVYFVFKNEKAQPSQTLMQMTKVVFKN